MMICYISKCLFFLVVILVLLEVAEGRVGVILARLIESPRAHKDLIYNFTNCVDNVGYAPADCVNRNFEKIQEDN